jgi:uncharacterized membrane protein
MMEGGIETTPFTADTPTTPETELKSPAILAAELVLTLMLLLVLLLLLLVVVLLLFREWEALPFKELESKRPEAGTRSG